MFNEENHIYRQNLWDTFTDIVRAMVKEGIIHKPSYMDLPFIKRFIFRKMFYSDAPLNETDITRSDFEYLDDYEGLRAVLAKMYVSGLVKHFNISFDELIKMDNYLVDWLFTWLEEQQRVEEIETNKNIKQLEAQVNAPPIDTSIRKKPSF